MGMPATCVTTLKQLKVRELTQTIASIVQACRWAVHGVGCCESNLGVPNTNELGLFKRLINVFL